MVPLFLKYGGGLNFRKTSGLAEAGAASLFFFLPNRLGNHWKADISSFLPCSHTLCNNRYLNEASL